MSSSLLLYSRRFGRYVLWPSSGVSCQIRQPRRQHPTRHQLYGHLALITKTIQVRRTRHAGHCWRSRDELIRDVFLWTPTHGRAKAGRPARTYIQQLCEDTGCCPEDLPRAMNDREEWHERVRDIRATSASSRGFFLFFLFLFAELFSALFFYSLTSSQCYMIAEGFRFMPLSLVRLRTFRLSTWVSWVQHWGRC